MRLGDTPVPIPNTTVKTKAAENTILETIWEDRWVPDPNPLKFILFRLFILSVQLDFAASHCFESLFSYGINFQNKIVIQ